MATFGAYEVVERIATGSTGTVYRARHVDIGRLVAIKELAPALRDVPGFLERFRSEARILATLDNPHIVAVYDYGEDDDRAWIVEEWIAGSSLSAILAAHRTLRPEQAVGVLRGALTGLAHAHDRGLLHRDIAPGNILADQAGTSKLVDFGLAAPVGEAGAFGTPAFMSPEAATGEPVGKTGDVYSAACVLFLLLSGRPPFAGSDRTAVMRAHRDDQAPLLTGSGPHLAAVVGRALSKDPADRPADAAEFLTELEEAADREYGAAWLSRASIAGLVVATTAAGATAAVGDGLGASPQLVPADNVVTTASADTGPASTPAQPAPIAPARPGRRLGKGAGVAVAAGLAAVVATGIGYAMTRDASAPEARADRAPSSTAAAAAGSPATSPISPSAASAPLSATTTPTASSAALAASTPTGRYRLDAKLVATDFGTPALGTTSTTTWQITLDCASTPCAGSIISSSGLKYTATYDGTTLRGALTGRETQPCYSPDGKKSSLGTGLIQYDLTAVLRSAKAAGRPDAAELRPASLTGTLHTTNTAITVTGNCTIGPPKSTEQSLVLTRLD